MRPRSSGSPHPTGRWCRARIYRPEDFGAARQRRGRPVRPRGAGYLQNAHRWWSTYFRTSTQFHPPARRARLRRARPLDFRASAGYGRDWRTRPSTATWAAATSRTTSTRAAGSGASSASTPSASPIYGGSYGGFLTLMALFTEPEPLRRRRGPALGHRLGPLQRHLHPQHPEHAAPRPGGVPALQPHRVRRRPGRPRS